MTTTATMTTRFNVAGFSGTYEITCGKARVVGWFRNADFPNEKPVPDMGEVFWVEVPEGMRRRGLGYTLVVEAIKLMHREGAKTVVMRGGCTAGGRAIVAKLVRNGVVSPAKRTSAGGTGIHDILIGTVQQPTQFHTRAAREACESGYGGPDYWRYLDEHARELAGKGVTNALTQSLADALKGNDGI